ncbi:MAG: hypothetical protein WCV00_21550 [Verrucomicrobiia bacterium]
MILIHAHVLTSHFAAPRSQTIANSKPATINNRAAIAMFFSNLVVRRAQLGTRAIKP